MSRCPEGIEAHFIKDCAAMTSPTLSIKYGKAQSTIREWRLDLYRRGRLLWWPGIRVHLDEDGLEDYVVVEGDTMIVSDLEIPHHDAELLGYLVSVAMKFGIKQLVIAGDFLALDSESPFAAEEGIEEWTLADETWAGKDVLEGLFQWFERIVLVKGNHEQRGTRKRELGFIHGLRNQWGDLGDLEVSLYKWCAVQSGGEAWRIEHFGNYAKVPGSVARERALIEDSHVAGGHTHHMSWSVALNGKHQAVDLGHCTRERTRYYKTVNGTTRHPKWVAGFWMIREGYAYPFPKEFTDWAFWLKQIKVR